jgi:hypothetical protein
MTILLKDAGKSKKASSKDEDSDVQDNAGNQFGGRKKKKQKKVGQQDCQQRFLQHCKGQHITPQSNLLDLPSLSGCFA